MYYANTNQRKFESIVVRHSGHRTSSITRDKAGHYTMLRTHNNPEQTFNIYKIKTDWARD